MLLRVGKWVRGRKDEDALCMFMAIFYVDIYQIDIIRRHIVHITYYKLPAGICHNVPVKEGISSYVAASYDVVGDT